MEIRLMLRRCKWAVCPGFALLLLVGCEQKPPSRWEQAQQKVAKDSLAVAEEAVEGGQFNRFFPQVDAPWDIVFKQEKTGFAQASLQQDGREVATLSVSDTSSNPQAVKKFRSPEKTIEGMPLANVGESATAILAGDRFQVQIRSTDPSFGPQHREEWLQKFNLQAIARIQ